MAAGAAALITVTLVGSEVPGGVAGDAWVNDRTVTNVTAKLTAAARRPSWMALDRVMKAASWKR